MSVVRLCTRWNNESYLTTGCAYALLETCLFGLICFMCLWAHKQVFKMAKPVLQPQDFGHSTLHAQRVCKMHQVKPQR